MIKQPVLAELQYFVSSVSLLYKGIPLKDPAALVKCSLHLLDDLPSTRDAVFEYFSLVFNSAVKAYLINVEKSNTDGLQDDDAIQEIHEALERLVTNGPPAWSPLISSWCLRLLGEICDKNSRRRPLDIRMSCNLWLGCNAIRCLMGLTALCFSKLDEFEVDACITGLLNTFSQYSPYFDWVVARLGGCFPSKVISKMLFCGLKRFTGEYDQVDSEVEVLSYLAATNEEDLKQALKEIVVRETNNKLTVPYLLHLSKNSEVLAQSLAVVFLDNYTDAHLHLIKVQSKFWPANYSTSNVIHIVINLLLKVKKKSIQVLLTLPRISEKYPWCQELLEMLFVELETIVLEKRSCPLLDDAVKDSSKELLWQSCLSDCTLAQQSAVRLILLASHKSSYFLQQSIAKMLMASSGGPTNPSKPHLNALARLLGGPHGSAEYPRMKPAFEIALGRMMLNPTGGKGGRENFNVLRNLVEIVKLERDSFNVHLKKTNCVAVLQELLGKLLAIWELLMNQEKHALASSQQVQEEIRPAGVEVKVENKRIKREGGETEPIDNYDTTTVFDQIHMIAKLIDCMELHAKVYTFDMAETLKLSQLTVRYFFLCLQQAHVGGNLSSEDDTNLNRCYQLLSRHSATRKAARTAALRDILEGALFLYGNLFGSQIESDSVEYSKPDELLIKLNQKQGLAMNASRSTVLHAGIIGLGPKQPVKMADGPELEMQNRLISAIVACCQDAEHQNTIDGYSYVSLLLVELVSPDVMYNGLPWPDEEFTKVTMERDLQIRRMFRTCPILWSILGLIACYRPALCYSSVLLRALCASALHQWRSKSAETMNGQKTELMYVTTKLLELLALGQLLPPPLSYLHIVLPYLDANEIIYVLKECIWNYLKDHVPSPVLFVCDPTGFHWRDPATSRPPPQYTNPLRHTMQRKLDVLGHLYQQMFFEPELRYPSVPSQPAIPNPIAMVNGLGGNGNGGPLLQATNGNGLPLVAANGNGHLAGLNAGGGPVILGPVVTID
ncbi:integrator complex subunit 5 [Topomyia yanbarensis]|uniref:integrator complex subunit 5 n=1 Tax=Topomyia yanbarensis TaxID=2498891 RepID=UPI00273B9D07|nr:integrator complex subunit 5 [Topomyia yanbarensis]